MPLPCCCYTAQHADNVDNFIVGLTNVHPLVSSPSIGNYDVCGRYTSAERQGATVRLQCEINTDDRQPARYVVVQLPETGRLRLCELEVYAPEGLAACQPYTLLTTLLQTCS